MEPHIFVQRFTSWDEIPYSLDHLLTVENNSVRAFGGDIVDVAYAVDNGQIMAFGSCGYYGDHNYYAGNEDSDDEEYGDTRHLWIEGLVSLRAGLGTAILGHLEQALIRLSEEYQVPNPIIYVMSVDESVGFYENNGYLECNTSPRFAGTGNIRLAKPIGEGVDMTAANLSTYDIRDYAGWFWGWVLTNRKKRVSDYVRFPEWVRPAEMQTYVLKHMRDEDFFKDSVSDELKQTLLLFRDEELDEELGFY